MEEAMKLYHSPRSRSARPRWLLEEIDVEVAIRDRRILRDLSARRRRRPGHQQRRQPCKFHPGNVDTVQS